MRVLVWLRGWGAYYGACHTYERMDNDKYGQGEGDALALVPPTRS